MTTKKANPKKAKAIKESRVQTGVSAGASVSKAVPAAPKAALPKHLRQDITKCSACGQDHTRVLFILSGRDYVATCPISGEKIYLKARG